MKSENKKGFTLVELLIVMAIIGILIAIAIIGLGSAQATARNQARQTSVKGISGLLETYYGNSGGTYPSEVGVHISGSGGYTNVGVVGFISPTGIPYSTGSSLCQTTIAPSNTGTGNFSSGTCDSNTYDFNISTPQPTFTITSQTLTKYFYIPFQNGSPVLTSTGPTTSVSSYIVGACLENNVIFAYSTSRSAASYTQPSPNTISYGGGADKITCNG